MTVLGGPGIWAMKLGDPQATQFTASGAGIQNAIDYCGVTGGKVFLGVGDFSVTSTITLKPDITIIGCGNRTRLDTGSSTTLDAISYTGSGADNVRVIDVGFLHVSSYTGASIRFTDAIDSWVVRCYGKNFFVNSCNTLRFTECVADGGKFDLTSCFNSTFRGCLAYNAVTPSADGWKLTTCQDNSFESCISSQAGGHGWNVIGSDRNTFVGCITENASYISSGISDNIHIDGTSDENVWTGGRSSNHIPTDPATYEAHAKYSVQLLAGATRNKFLGVGVGLAVTAAFLDSGTSTVRVQNSDDNNTTLIGDLDVAGNLRLRGLNATFGTTGSTATATIGQGTTGTDLAQVIARSGNSGATESRFELNRNGASFSRWVYNGSNTYLDVTGGLILREGIGGPTRFRIDANGKVVAALGYLPDAGGMKHQRVTTGSIGATTDVAVTVTWGTAFADTSYTVFAEVVDSTTSSLSLKVIHVDSISASAVVVRVRNDSAGSLTGTLHCVGIHD